MSLDAAGVSVVFINDYEGRQQPVLALDIDKVCVCERERESVCVYRIGCSAHPSTHHPPTHTQSHTPSKARYNMESCADAVKGDASVIVRASFFNPSVLFWEPLIEPWCVVCEDPVHASLCVCVCVCVCVRRM
jgi:hypothetical protein